MKFILAIVALVTGIVFGGPFAGYLRGGRWLGRTLEDYGALAAFWSEAFQPSGGVLAVLNAGERGTTFEPQTESDRVGSTILRARLIEAEIAIFPRMRRLMGLVLLALSGAWCWASLHYSFLIFSFFLLGVLVSVVCYPKSGQRLALYNMFLYVRSWMLADPASLEEFGKRMHLDNIVRVLRDKEPVEK
jgi:hypothetical protein